MGTLGVPVRVTYEAKNLQSGLTDIIAMVMKPDGVVVGPFSMPQLPSPFLGRYFFDFTSTTSGLEGDYLVLIASPSEAYQTTYKFSLYAPSSANDLELNDIDVAVATLLARLTSTRAAKLDLLDASISSVITEVQNNGGGGGGGSSLANLESITGIVEELEFMVGVVEPVEVGQIVGIVDELQ